VAEPASIAARDVLAQQLDCFSMAALQQMARNLGLKQTPKQRIPLLNALCDVVGTPAHFRILETQLSPLQRTLLELLPVRLGTFTLHHLAAVLTERGITGQPAVDALRGLLAHACFVPLEPPYGPQKIGLNLGEYGFTGHQLHYDLVPNLLEWVRSHPSSDPSFTAADAPLQVRGSGLLELQRALLVITGELSRRPLRLTTTGLLNKTDLVRLTKAVAVASGQAAPKGANAPIPPLVWFTVAVAHQAGLVAEVPGGLQTVSDAPEFYRRPVAEQLVHLFSGWMSCHCNEFAFVSTVQIHYSHLGDPWITVHESAFGANPTYHLESARALTVAALIEGVHWDPDRWYALDDLARYVFSQYPDILFSRGGYDSYYSSPFGYAYNYGRGTGKIRRPYPGLYRAAPPEEGIPFIRPELQLFMDTDWMEVEGAYVRQMVAEAMRWLGLIEVDEPPPGEQPTRFHLTELGQHILLDQPLAEPAAEPATGHAIVQPNYEVVVTDAAASLGLIAQLDAFAERRTLDRAAIYVLTAEALIRGLDQGWTGEQILRTLETAAGSPLPQNVRFSLMEWIARYEAVSVHEAATLLEADSPEQLEAWLADPDLAPLLGSRLGSSTLLVPARHRDQVADRLLSLTPTYRQVDYAYPPSGILTLHDPDQLAISPDHLEPYLDYRLRTFADSLVIRSEPREPSSVPAPTEPITYHLTQESVHRAIAEGFTPATILDFLARAAGKAIPPDMRIRILGWGGAIPAVTAESVVAVGLPPDGPTWPELRKIRVIRRLLRGIPSKELALVPADQLDALTEVLTERGIELRPGQVSLAPPEDDPQTTLHDAFLAFGNPELALELVDGWARAEIRKQNRRYGW
jgi:hypothetical protein